MCVLVCENGNGGRESLELTQLIGVRPHSFRASVDRDIEGSYCGNDGRQIDELI